MADVPRRTFGPVVLLGIASAGLAALAGSRAWVGFDVVEDPDTGSGGSYSSTIGISLTGLPEAPLVAALGKRSRCRRRASRAARSSGSRPTR